MVLLILKLIRFFSLHNIVFELSFAFIRKLTISQCQRIEMEPTNFGGIALPPGEKNISTRVKSWSTTSNYLKASLIRWSSTIMRTTCWDHPCMQTCWRQHADLCIKQNVLRKSCTYIRIFIWMEISFYWTLHIALEGSENPVEISVKLSGNFGCQISEIWNSEKCEEKYAKDLKIISIS